MRKKIIQWLHNALLSHPLTPHFHGIMPLEFYLPPTKILFLKIGDGATLVGIGGKVK